jgi:hypothetical protein
VSETEVLIVGAGPVGLTLAVDIGMRGVRCTLVEQKEAPQFLPKMERCNARTMEIFRRMGLADRIRAAGLPADCPMDVFIVTSLIEPPLLHLPYPSVTKAKREIAASTDAQLPLEPYQLISQYTLEPLLKSVAGQLPSVSVRYGTEFLDFVEHGDGVTARLRTGTGDAEIAARYLVGCDGGASPIRKQLGIALAGEGNLLELRQALCRCEDLYERIPIGRGRHYHVADERSTQLIVQDSTRHFTLHGVVDADADMVALFEKTIAMPLAFETNFLGTYGDAMDKRLDDIIAQARYARQSGYPRFAVVSAVTAIELITRYMLVEPLLQTKEAETDMFSLPPPRHIPIPRKPDGGACARKRRFATDFE